MSYLYQRSVELKNFLLSDYRLNLNTFKRGLFDIQVLELREKQCSLLKLIINDLHRNN